MKEQRLIIDKWRRGSGSILVSLVRVEGSSYRRPGARLLICKDGSYEGNVSAGCLEADLLRKAAWLSRGGAVVERYSTLFDEESDIPFGLGCGGVLDVLLESVETPECIALLSAMESTSIGEERSVATWLPTDGSPLKRVVLRDDGEVVFSSAGLSSRSLSHAKIAWSRKDGNESDVPLFEKLVSPQRLFIFGAGDDAKPLAAMATLLGWSVTVADDRTHLARRSRFLDTNIQVVDSVEYAIRQIETRDAAVIMTHSFEQDGNCLSALLVRQPRYLGLLGARQRSSLLIREAAAGLGLSVSQCCARLSAPTGLDLGGDGPEAVALAILSEAQATCNGREVASRKLSAELVESYVTDHLDRRLLKVQCGLDLV
ncbi:XdhC family protein [Tunturiibacter lichenicola]|uniref:XdhC family protein n=1 Tax=Tunturiibacter lichenicola TaxID=2051959 RepID=UPI0021B28493|nr:XdhC/CoxI family protein [Edaphobacter lichenicola]